MKVAVIGPSDASKLTRLIGLEESKIEKRLEEVAKILVPHSLLVIPDKGIPIEVAKFYKKLGGKEVIGYVPRLDKDYGIEHLKPFLHLLDKEIEVNDWHNAVPKMIHESDYVICLGLAPGVLIELGYVKYNLKWKKKKVKKVYVFKDMISAGQLPIELEEEIKSVLAYINSPAEINLK